MMQIYREIKRITQKVEEIEENVWIHLVAPTQEEIDKVSTSTGLMLELLKAALDAEERPRIETEENQMLIIINIPISSSILSYKTIPLGIIINSSFITTVCLQDTSIIYDLIARSKIHTGKRTRLFLQLLYRIAILYIQNVRSLNLKAQEIEMNLRKSMKNKEMFDLLEIQKSLVYLSTALKANEILMEKLMRYHLRPTSEKKNEQLPIRLYPEDEDILEDAITENHQAFSMADVHSNILSGTMDAFASIISNNLNIVMKFLASMTIILAIPALLGTFYGMNVPLPFEKHPFAFTGIMIISAAITLITIIIFLTKKML
ncbi:magnesium transporter CorA family protein [Candidatus Poribacteria bacterium]|nr:magnesium transporter CorA family protein [Candidatus Poribacteria bacterium]